MSNRLICSSPCNPERVSLGYRMASLVGSVLMILVTGVVALTLPSPVAIADPGLPDVTVHVTTAPMTNLTPHTGVTRTASCPTGTLVGGDGYLRNATPRPDWELRPPK